METVPWRFRRQGLWKDKCKGSDMSYDDIEALFQEGVDNGKHRNLRIYIYIKTYIYIYI